MKYKNIKEGIFKERPNRFIAYVEIDGKLEVCHVKNTGRCKELLTPNAKVYLEESDNPDRKTKYDLISVYKGDKLFNIDSQAPNKVFGEWAKESGYFKNVTLVKPEKKFGNSRFDFYIEADGKKIFAEVKGVTLEKDGVLMFPDAPTERGLKHLSELMECIKAGYEAYIIFVVQMREATIFKPNEHTHPEFAKKLREAQKAGVTVIAINCEIAPNSISPIGKIDLIL
jgi:sugar fermentation stimulation protein A